MRDETTADIYAQTLLEAAAERGILEAVLDETVVLHDILQRERDLRLFLENPRLEAATKRSVLARSLEGRVSDLMVDFVSLVIDKRRQDRLFEILGRFSVLYDKKVGRMRGEVTTAIEADVELIERLASRVGAELGREVVLSTRVDPTVLGGMVVRFDGLVADASLKTELEEVRASLSGLKFGSELVHED